MSGKGASADKSQNTRDVPDLASTQLNSESNKSNEKSNIPENKHSQEQDSDSEEEEEEGVDPKAKEKERKVSEKRIIEIVHKDSIHVLHSNEAEGGTDRVVFELGGSLHFSAELGRGVILVTYESSYKVIHQYIIIMDLYYRSIA